MTARAAASRPVAAAPVLRIAEWGAHAERFAERRASARVAAVYARSLHLEAAGDFLCLGDASIGRGPLNAILRPDDWTRLEWRMPTAGAGVRIARGAIWIGATAVCTVAARQWRPAPWPRAGAAERRRAALEQLDGLARDRAPDDGLARAALALPLDRPTALDRLARPPIVALQRWLEARIPGAARGSPPVGLLGLGTGLTPSGDDLLCGALVALHGIGRADIALQLSTAIAAAAAAATGALSGAFLAAAGEGLGAEPLHAAIAAAVQGQDTDLARHVDALGRIGHTSGWDALAGAVLVLRAFGTIDGQRGGVARPRNTL